MTHSKRVEAFIAALEELTRKTGLKVQSCSCCDSPWLVTLSRKERGKKYGYQYDFKGYQHMETPEIVCERLSWDTPPLPEPEPVPEVIPEMPAPITDADTAKDRAVYDAWRAKQP